MSRMADSCFRSVSLEEGEDEFRGKRVEVEVPGTIQVADRKGRNPLIALIDNIFKVNCQFPDFLETHV